MGQCGSCEQACQNRNNVVALNITPRDGAERQASLDESPFTGGANQLREQAEQDQRQEQCNVSAETQSNGTIDFGLLSGDIRQVDLSSNPIKAHAHQTGLTGEKEEHHDEIWQQTAHKIKRSSTLPEELEDYGTC
mmetsp:Transcript_105968/g.187515  ORF Transcript_105968/g.187515 Transcript_105968/m.187515 type:complete len:135 (-) Transcript_105968:213-617(-)